MMVSKIKKSHKKSPSIFRFHEFYLHFQPSIYHCFFGPNLRLIPYARVAGGPGTSQAKMQSKRPFSAGEDWFLVGKNICQKDRKRETRLWRLLKLWCQKGGPNILPRWWFQIFLEFSPRSLGKIPILTSIFFRWVVQPPTRKPWHPEKNDLEFF